MSEQALRDRVTAAKYSLSAAHQQVEGAERAVVDAEHALAEYQKQHQPREHGEVFTDEHGNVYIVDLYVPGFMGSVRLWQITGPGASDWPTHAPVSYFADRAELSPVLDSSGRKFKIGRGNN